MDLGELNAGLNALDVAFADRDNNGNFVGLREGSERLPVVTSKTNPLSTMIMKPITTPIEFFGADECACKGTGVIKMDPRFAEALPLLRKAWGSPLGASSICRTPAHNKAERGHPSSLHLTENPKWPTLGSMAADIKWRNWPVQRKLAFARLAWSMGWSVGLHSSFCHIDRRGDLGLANLPQNVFLYGAWHGAFTPSEVRK